MRCAPPELMFRSRFLLASLGWSLMAVGIAADEFPPPFNTEPLSEANRLDPQAAAAGFALPAGFRAIPFAAEPDVQNPIAMAWDGRGRLWIAENYTYAERRQGFQLDLRDRVIILDNTCGDRFQQRTVFTDQLQMLTGIAVGHGGVWLMCPPQLLFIPDRDRDDVPDGPATVVLDGFTVAKESHHNFANGLRFGPDGWLYGRCGGSCPGRIGSPGTPDEQRFALEGGLWRYHPQQRWVEVLTHGTTNPWGHDWNDVGEAFFVNTVNGHLWHAIAGAHFARPFTLDPNPWTYELIDFHADHWHFDTGQPWQQSRSGAANDFGGGHAHQGAMIYQGSRWPAEYRDRLLTVNLHGLRVNQEQLTPRGSGYVAEHADDFLIAADPWFRGLDLSVGPDGQVFVIDWSDTGECHEHTGVHRTSGRVFKLEYSGRGAAAAAANPPDAARGTVAADPEPFTAGQPIDVAGLSPRELARWAISPEAWRFRQARLELASRFAAGEDLSAATDLLTGQLASAEQTVPRQLRALFALHAAGGTDEALLTALLADDHAYLRTWAIRLMTESWPLDDTLGPVAVSKARQTQHAEEVAKRLPLLIQLATDDPSPVVRLTLASTLQRLPLTARPSLAARLVAHPEDAEDHNLPLMLWYGVMALAEHHPDQLLSVAQECRIPTTLRLISRALAQQIEFAPEPIDALIAAAASADEAYRGEVIAGIEQGWAGWQRVTRPQSWSALVAATQQPPSQQALQRLSALFGDGRSIGQLESIALGQTEAPYPIRLAALDTLIQVGGDHLQGVCSELLGDARMNAAAAQGLSRFGSPEVARKLIARYRSFRAPQRPELISILVSRPEFARELLAAIGQGKIPREDLTAVDVRQIRQLQDDHLDGLLADVWGQARDSTQTQRALMEHYRQVVTEAGRPVHLGRGRSLFRQHCQGCHRLYGEGETVGPDLTGGNRGNLDYLLENIVDPGAVVDKDFRMTALLTKDGRLLTGLVTAETPRTVTIRTATTTLTLDNQTIQSRRLTEQSAMPEGLLAGLSDEQVRDLIAYLRHPVQVDLDYQPMAQPSLRGSLPPK